jgi:hypothetical protein
MTKPYLTPAQAATVLDLTPTACREAIRTGRLPARKVLGRLRLDPDVVARVAAGAPAFKEPCRETVPPAAA